MNLTLLKKECKSNLTLFILFLCVLSIYAVMIVALFDPQMSASLKTMTAVMPQLFSAFGMADIGTTLLDFISGYLYGMIFVVFPGVFLIILTNRLITRYIDRGSLVYLLSTPNKRRRIAFTQALFMIFTLIILVGYLTVLLLASSHAMFPGELKTAPFLRVNAGLLGLLIFFGGICFFISCLFNESKYALGINTAILVYSVLLQMIANMGDTFRMLRYLTPVTLFDTDGLAGAKGSAFALTAILYLTGILFINAGILYFERKDLPI